MPFGTTLGELLDIAGGVQGELGAIMLGGAAGVFVGSEHLDMPLTFEDARERDASLGSGVVMVFDTSTDFAETLRRIAEFFSRRILRSVCAMPGRNGAPRRTAGSPPGWQRTRDGPLRRNRGRDGGCLDLRTRTYGVGSDSIGAGFGACAMSYRLPATSYQLPATGKSAIAFPVLYGGPGSLRLPSTRPFERRCRVAGGGWREEGVA